MQACPPSPLLTKRHTAVLFYSYTLRRITNSANILPPLHFVNNHKQNSTYSVFMRFCKAWQTSITPNLQKQSTPDGIMKLSKSIQVIAKQICNIDSNKANVRYRWKLKGVDGKTGFQSMEKRQMEISVGKAVQKMYLCNQRF